MILPQKSSLILTRTGGEKARKAYNSDIRSWTCRKDWNSHIQSTSPVHRMPKIKAPTEGRGTPTACTARDLVKIQVVMWLVYMRIFDWKKWESIFSYTNMSRLIYVRITLLGVTQSASSSCKCTCWWFGIPSALWFCKSPPSEVFAVLFGRLWATEWIEATLLTELQVTPLSVDMYTFQIHKSLKKIEK